MNFQGSGNDTNTRDARIRRPRPHGIVYNFAAYTHEQYEAMSKELGLSLTAQQLQSCAGYYGKYEHRDPSLDEIYFIDGFAYAFPESRYAFGIKSFFCDDEYIYRTYSDMMEKFTEIYNDPKLPPPLSIYPIIADIYLERAGKKRLFPKGTEISYISKDRIFCEAFATNTEIFKESSEKGGWYITQKSTEKKRVGSAPKDSDVFLLLSSENADNDINTLSECVRRFGAEGLFIFSVQVGKGGVTGAALRIASGISIWTQNIESIFLNAHKNSDDADDSGSVNVQTAEETNSFGIDTPKVFLTDMSQSMYSELPFPAVLVRADRTSLQYIIARLRSEFPGIKHTIAGEAIRGSRFVFKDNSGGIRFSFDGGFLRSITAVKYTDMRMNRLPYSPKKLKHRTDIISAETSACGIGSRRAIFTRLQKIATGNGYLDGVYAIVDTVCQLAAKGLSYENTEICTHLTFPVSDGTACFSNFSVPTENYESVSAYIALTAGIYRARAELALRGGNITSFSETDYCPSIEALGYSVTDKKIDNNYENDDCECENIYSALKGVYLLDVSIDDDGIPDFEELRGLLKYISDTARENPTVRAYYPVGTDIGQFLSERYGGRLKYAAGYMPRGSENDRGLVFVIESDSPVLGTFVGKIYGNNERSEQLQ